MSSLSPLHRKVLIKKLRKLGFSGPLPATRHEYMIKDKHKIFIPNPHKNKEISLVIIKEIIKQLNIDNNEFINL
ncbi:MAG: type II toxin-antitoxin system HicA family toxin [bacterium]